MKRILIFSGMLLLVLSIGYPLGSELIQLESVQRSKEQFQKTVLGDSPGQTTLQNNHLRKNFRDLGFYPASLDQDKQSFELSTLEDETRSLEDYRGKWLVMNFWATWCPPCRMEMPSLDQLQDKFRDKPLRVITINVQQNPSPIRQFKNNYGFDLPILLDESGTVTRNYGATGLPETWILSPTNRPIVKLDGPLEWHSDPIVSALQRLIELSQS